ncbi:MAG: glycosyltransferase family 2 protein [Planctomycetes bacterium]|nr:glycosyltransferase family 2 protein [Planctomycetota bacterium]
MTQLSVVIPAYNEAGAIREVVLRLREVLVEAAIEFEVLVVVDGATDATADEAREAGATVVEHPQNSGYGRSLKTGILAAKHDLIAITDADGTYPVERIPELARLAERYSMVVGARTGAFYQGSMIKRMGRFVFRHLSQFAAGQKIPDINSGLRVFRRQDIVPFFPVISAGFSFTTTSTLVYLLNDLFVHYVPIDYHRRAGTSKVRHLRDALRALQIIVEAIVRCNPIKIFLLLAFPFLLAGVGLTIWGLVASNWTIVLGGVVSWSASGVLLGLGFLAVAVMPPRRSPPTLLHVPNAWKRSSDGAVDEGTTHGA